MTFWRKRKIAEQVEKDVNKLGLDNIENQVD
jgi:hypothetical protein